MARPELVRTWVSDVPGVFDAEYVWHDLAQAWQTPEVGEAAVSDFTSMSDAGRVDFLVDGRHVGRRRDPGLARHRRRRWAGRS